MVDPKHIREIVNKLIENKSTIKFVDARRLLKSFGLNEINTILGSNINFIDLFRNAHELEYFNGEYICSHGSLDYNTDLNSMFDGCLNLKLVNLSYAFSNAVSTLNIQLNGMFKNFMNLEQVNLDSTFQNAKGTNLISCREMFENCLNLKYVNVKRMFNGVQHLTEIDLTRMFANCKNLYSISFTDFLTDCNKLTKINAMNMFENCDNLKWLFLVDACKKEGVTITLRDSFVCNISIDINEYGIDYYELLSDRKDSFCDGIINNLGVGSNLYVSAKREFNHTLLLRCNNLNVTVYTVKEGKLHKKYGVHQNSDGEYIFEEHIPDFDPNTNFMNDVVFKSM